MTAFNSLATGRKWRMARLSSARVARAKCLESCSMQKYGVSNSSCSRMTWAPCPAALRAKRSARAMLASMSQSHAIWVAATVTWRFRLLVMRAIYVGLDVTSRSGLRNRADRHLLIHLAPPFTVAHVNDRKDHANRDDP